MAQIEVKGRAYDTRTGLKFYTLYMGTIINGVLFT